jgi:DNA-binding transcriptional LysR family regulator
MDWDNVRVFLAVARAGQFVAAAKRLKLDHATVSRRIAALEAALGAKLFNRRTTGAKLTSAGERFLGAAEQMESAFLHAQGEISGVDLELTGDVRIGAPDGFSTYYLTGALGDFAERHPTLRLQLMPLPQLTPLARREVDVVIGLDKPEAGRFVARKLTDYTLGIYASAAYAKRDGLPADIDALRRHRLIGYVEEHAFSTALDYVRELYDGAPTSFESTSAVTQLEALRAGVGLGVVHDFIARRFKDLVRVLPERRAMRAYWLVTHEDTRGLGRIRAVAEHLGRAVARDRAMFLSPQPVAPRSVSDEAIQRSLGARRSPG